MWRETTKHERNLKIFREEIDDFLPEKILDFHVHLLNEDVVPAGEKHGCAGHEITKYTIGDLARDLEEVYPGRETSAVCFGHPRPDWDRESNNGYVSEVCDGRRFFALRLYDPHEDVDAVREDLARGRFLGLKPYPDYAAQRRDAQMSPGNAAGASDLAKVEIRDMLPEAVMEVVNELGAIVMLHLPRPGRLADPVNQRQIVELCERYPGAKVVLAHIGRAYFLKNVVGSLDNLKDLPNLYYDLAMLNNWEVLEHLFDNAAPEKILYATDTPIALAPGKSVEINDQYTYVTPVPWKLSISDDHGKLVFTSFLYEELRAIRKAVERLDLDEAFVRGIFHENGMRLIQGVGRGGRRE